MTRSSSAGRGYSVIELLFVVGLIGVLSAIAVPMMGNTLNSFRLSGDARSVANAISLSKMRAAATFSKARVYIDLSTNSFRVETFQKTSGTWVPELGSTYLNARDSFGFGSVSSPPPNTQVAISQPAQCLDSSSHAIGNTACVLFNSRGTPIDTSNNPIGTNAVYLTDGTAVYGSTVSATGMIRLWQTPPTSTPSWTSQ